MKTETTLPLIRYRIYSDELEPYAPESEDLQGFAQRYAERIASPRASPPSPDPCAGPSIPSADGGPSGETAMKVHEERICEMKDGWLVFSTEEFHPTAVEAQKAVRAEAERRARESGGMCVTILTWDTCTSIGESVAKVLAED